MTGYRPARRFLLLLLLALPLQSAYALRVERYFSASAAGGKGIEVARGSSLVRFKTGISSSAAAQVLSAAGFQVRNQLKGLGWVSVSLPAGMSVSQGLSLLQGTGIIEAAVPNRVYRPSRVPSDPFLGSQYALSRIEAYGAWEYGTGFPGTVPVTVAMIDTGIDGTHPELKDKLVGTSRAFTPEASPTASDDDLLTPVCNHATRGAGVAAAEADNAAGIAGVSWGAQLISMKVFDSADCYSDCENKPGRICATTDEAIALAIVELNALHDTPALGKIVVNISLGDSGSCSSPLQSAIAAAHTTGLMVIAAAGNGYASEIDSPASCPYVIAVGATDNTDSLAAFSNSDTLMISRGLTAPGVEIYTTDISSGYAPASGTSFSSPMTAGLAALLWAAKPSASNDDVKGYMMDSADDLGAAGPDRYYGHGRINALKAMRLALGLRDANGTDSRAVAYPNPFRPKRDRRATFTVPEPLLSANSEVKIYTTEGELVRKLDALDWDGRNDAGIEAASGVYIFRVKTDNGVSVGKMALIR
ncbi:MAG: hypothetical protein COT18_04520 [Elusimicrobia bacterium CG08_land_8_20_14_0_20_59_10]|nr:MAG: hypothetical protein COT18_04520 [Elusimicrobia bacterium CG08_land_8_20_14_0_20_59_10]